MEDVFRREALLDFWPSSRQTAKERVEATTRFIVYATAIVLLIRRDGRVLALGALVLAILYGLYYNNMIPDGARAVFLANMLIGDEPSRPGAAWYPSVKTEVENQWSHIHPFERVRDAERNFYTTASSVIPNDQTMFAQAAYGRPFEPQCRDTPGACDPEGNPFSTFPERVQMRAGNGGGYGGGKGGGGF
jgi:hypothetical protein